MINFIAISFCLYWGLFFYSELPKASISLSLFSTWKVIIKAFRSVINVLDYSFDDDFIIGGVKVVVVVVVIYFQ